MTDVAAPRTEPERSAWYAGAAAEHTLQVEGMSPTGREVYDFVKVVAQNGADGDRLVDYTARVYTSAWPLRRRLALAWALLRG